MQNFHDFHEFQINEIGLEALSFRNFKNPNSKTLDPQVKMCFCKENLPQGRTNFTDTNF